MAMTAAERARQTVPDQQEGGTQSGSRWYSRAEIQSNDIAWPWLSGAGQ
jgi:hypothetical protein